MALCSPQDKTRPNAWYVAEDIMMVSTLQPCCSPSCPCMPLVMLPITNALPAIVLASKLTIRKPKMTVSQCACFL